MLKFVYDIDSCPCSKVHISLRKIKSHGTEKSCVNISTLKCKVTQEIFSSYSKINSSKKSWFIFIPSEIVVSVALWIDYLVHIWAHFQPMNICPKAQNIFQFGQIVYKPLKFSRASKKTQKWQKISDLATFLQGNFYFVALGKVQCSGSILLTRDHCILGQAFITLSPFLMRLITYSIFSAFNKWFNFDIIEK